MYKVMIVDDEPIIRFGLKSSIDWKNERLHLVGDYSNGKQALDAMEKTDRIDILITDIKMPVMDGITLMKKALLLNPRLKVVLVSSYNEFEYVREGLTHGAVDYILKPTLEPANFANTIRKCVEKIHEEQSMKEKLDSAERTNSMASRRKLEQEMKRILLKKNQPVKCDSIIETFQAPHNVILVKMKQIGKVEEEFGFLYKSLIIEEIQARFYMEMDEGICFPIGENELLFFLKKTKDPLSVANTIKEKIEKETSIGFTFGYDVVANEQDLVSGYHRALLASQRHFLHSDMDVFKYRPAVEEALEPLGAEELNEALKPYEEYNVMNFLEERHRLWSSERMTPTQIKKEACDILETLFLKKIELTILMENFSKIESAETLEELYHHLKSGIQECNQSLAKTNKPNTDNELLDKALHYIHDHYTHDMTLQNVADHIHISRNYFSILFKRFLQQNFIDYVIDLRVKKAKELLSHTTLKVYEVAGQAGFNDVKYFSKLFKKVTGFSPGDFRTHHHK